MGLLNLICCGSGAALSPSGASVPSVHRVEVKALHSKQNDSIHNELTKVTQLLQCMAEVRGTPIEQLQGAAELIADHLDVSLASISVLTEAPVLSAACIAAGGDDAGVAQLGVPLTIVPTDEYESHGAQTSTHMVLEQKCYVYAVVPDASMGGGKDLSRRGLPADWHVLHKLTGLRAFAAVPIIRGGRILGVLSVASPRTDGVSGAGMPAMLEAAATWLSQWVEGGGLLRLGQLMSEVWCAGDVEALIRAVCLGLQDHYKSRMQLKLNARLALLGSSNSALIYEEQHGAPAGLSPSASSILLHQPGNELEPAALNSPKIAYNKPPVPATDVHAKLKQIRNSTAVSSLEDLRNLTTAITTNDRAHELFARESQTLAHANSSALPSGASPPMGSTLLAAYSGNAPSGTAVGAEGRLNRPSSGSLMRASLTSRSYNGYAGASNALASYEHMGAAPASPRLAGSVRGGNAAPGTPRRSSTTMNGNGGYISGPGGAVSGADSSVGLRRGTSSALNAGGARLGGQNVSGTDRPSSNRAGSFVGGQVMQRQASSMSMALSEDVLLRMVHEADNTAPPGHMMAHTMPNLERTVLAQAMGMPYGERGTWISDVATYMTQPNRPGRDIVVSARSPPVASLVIACLSAPRPTSNSSGNKSTVPPGLGLGSLHASPAAPQHANSVTEFGSEGDVVVLGVYLTSGTTLSALQLQAVLRELNLVLGLLSQPVVVRLRGALRDEVGNLLATMLGTAGGGVLGGSCDSISSLHAGSAAGLAAAGSGFTPPAALGLLSSLMKQRARRSSKAEQKSGELSGLITWMDTGAGTSGQHSAQGLMAIAQFSGSNAQLYPASPSGGVGQRARSFTLYSRGPVVPQVAPLVAGLQDRMRSLLAARQHTGCFNRHEDLGSVRAEVLIAHGGFGSVYQGLWQGLEVAIKVVPQRMDHSDSVREAVELAVMSTVSHPNILGVQNFWTDVNVTSGPFTPGERRPNGLLRLESGIVPGASIDDLALGMGASPGPSPRATTGSYNGKAGPEVRRCMVIIMELCDQGSLDEAIHRGAFRLLIPGKAPRINMLAVLTTLLEVAMALRHMHSMQLVHCDLKPGNVLLKSSLSDVRQFTTKLCDFGLVKFRQEAVDLTEQIRRATFTGTVTHSPPEMLRGDPNPDYCYDVYALGIVMWELISSQPVYAGLSDRQVAQQVVYNNLRPEFPRGIDPQYKELAQRCWAPDASDRPSMDAVVQALSSMLMSLRERAAAAAAAAAASAAATSARAAAAGSAPRSPAPQGGQPHGADLTANVAPRAQ